MVAAPLGAWGTFCVAPISKLEGDEHASTISLAPPALRGFAGNGVGRLGVCGARRRTRGSEPRAANRSASAGAQSGDGDRRAPAPAPWNSDNHRELGLGLVFLWIRRARWDG